MTDTSALVGIVMGSRSDWSCMELAAHLLDEMGVSYEARVVSAHRTPHRLVVYGEEAHERGLKVLIAAAGGAAHLAGMLASLTHLPVLGVPVATKFNHGLDSLLSMVQMPKGIPVGTLAVGENGAVNAALLACAILALEDEQLTAKLKNWRKQQTKNVPLLPYEN